MYTNGGSLARGFFEPRVKISKLDEFGAFQIAFRGAGWRRQLRRPAAAGCRARSAGGGLQHEGHEGHEGEGRKAEKSFVNAAKGGRAGGSHGWTSAAVTRQ